MTGFLLGCGSPQPTGDLLGCSGEVTVKEESSNFTGGGSTGVTAGYPAGQYFQFHTHLTVKEIMIKTYSINTTAIKINIYKGRITDTLDTATTQPLKQMIVTKGLTINDKLETWLELPEPYEFQVPTAEEQAAGIMYFISFEPEGSGIFSYFAVSRDSASRWRQGVRAWNGNGGFTSTATGAAIDMGFRGEPHCELATN